MFLAETEITALTGYQRRSAQVRALRSMGIEHRVRPDGGIIISRAHVEKILDGSMEHGAKQPPKPNWEALNGPQADKR